MRPISFLNNSRNLAGGIPVSHVFSLLPHTFFIKEEMQSLLTSRVRNMNMLSHRLEGRVWTEETLTCKWRWRAIEHTRLLLRWRGKWGRDGGWCAGYCNSLALQIRADRILPLHFWRSLITLIDERKYKFMKTDFFDSASFLSDWLYSDHNVPDSDQQISIPIILEWIYSRWFHNMFHTRYILRENRDRVITARKMFYNSNII